ncbi:5-deoxyglucuronate isomerase, partial [Xanthomonas hyacinthi DSM 19077]
MSLLVKAAAQGEAIVRVTPESAHWKHVGFEARRLAKGETTTITLPADREGCLVILTGTVDVLVAGHDWKGLGGRESVFEDRSTHAIYAPPSSVYEVTAQTDAELAIASAPAS